MIVVPPEVGCVWRPPEVGCVYRPPEGGTTSGPSQRLGSDFAGADADDFGQIGDEDLAVPDAARAGSANDRIDDIGNDCLGNDHLEAHFGNEVDGVFCPAVRFLPSPLPSEPADFGHSDPGYAARGQLILHIFQAMMTDDGF